ncbi:polyamine-transporting ATPase 13A3-like isoform X1 [Macrosteles quadrilineatus]|uniref:polyamine-transporting ATPase 13A3-like isoform X1 n=1 Tax=Macrosteles quadrilineatus TaxID=74068 RepID=UPI0023E289DD|nr:polyamine-transporting ATPase 13A3-like isoform X1 [Macrosteles quadrilineatus]
MIGINLPVFQNKRNCNTITSPGRNAPLRRSGYEVLEAPSVQIIDCGKEERNLKCTGYRKCWLSTLALHTVAVIFFGIPYLFLRWYPRCYAFLGLRRCSLDLADTVLIQVPWGTDTIHKVYVTAGSEVHGAGCTMRFFVHQLRKFIWTPELREFRLLQGLANDKNTLQTLLDNHTDGLSPQQQKQTLAVYGRNQINVEVKSYWRLLIDEILNPFYVFEIASIIFWCYDTYIFYSVFIIIISAYSIIDTLIQTRKISLMTNKLVEESNSNKVTVSLDDGETAEIESEDLVPGDTIVIPPHGCLMTCDALLLSGNCIVNESVLTGESVPVMKSPPAYVDEVYDPHAAHSRHTLYRGTRIVQSRFYENNKVLALVVRTGADTANGQLVRSILYPKNYGFHLYTDSMKFLFLMFFIALIGTGLSIYLYILHGAAIEDMILRSLDIITIVVPPALPAAITIGNNYSLKRLKKQNIFSTSVSLISVWGKVKLICFDKTGTLTEEGLDVLGVVPCGKTNLDGDTLVTDLSTLDSKSPLTQTMACCHTLTYIDKKLSGDPLDLSMFSALQWELEEPGEDTTKYDLLIPAVVKPKRSSAANSIVILDEMLDNLDEGETIFEMPYEIGVVKQFPFNTTSMTMTVIARVLGSNHMTVFTKGAPESIVNICLPSSVPDNIETVLCEYTARGYRVIALAYNKLPRKFTWLQAQRSQRHEVEKDLTFLGLLLMQNTLKPKSRQVISELQKARIKCVMVTGDNLLTAVSVSRECGMLPRDCPLSLVTVDLKNDPENPVIRLKSLSILTSPDFVDILSMGPSSGYLAIDGTNWSLLRTHFPSMVGVIATKCIVFARMSPNHKTQLVEVLQSMDYIVAMVGDGANDCGALKAAHVSVSLSQAEASIAAPFTSRRQDVTCVLDLMKEGRCALVTSFGLFKYMATYSLIQFMSVLILYNSAVELSNIEFLYVDLVITTSLAFMMGRAGPAKFLVPHRPVMSLVAPANVIPLLLHITNLCVIQILSLYILQAQPWYVPVNPEVENGGAVESWENTVVYTISCFQFFIQACVFSKGKPHRQPFHTNWVFGGFVLVLTGFTTLLLIYPPSILAELFELKPWTPNEAWFRVSLMALPLVNTIIAVLIENGVGESRLLKIIIHKINKKKQPKNKYKQVEKEGIFGYPYISSEVA